MVFGDRRPTAADRRPIAADRCPTAADRSADPSKHIMNIVQNNEFSLWLQRQILDNVNVIRQETTTNLELELNEILEDGEINEITGEINENNDEINEEEYGFDPYYEEERDFPYNYDSH